MAGGRWVRRSLTYLALLVALVAVFLVVALDSLDQPWLKRRVQAIARASAGVEIDYRAVRIGVLSGAEVDGLVVQSPAEVGLLVAGIAPGSGPHHPPAGGRGRHRDGCGRRARKDVLRRPFPARLGP